MSKFQVVSHRRYGIGQVQSIGANFVTVRFAGGSFACSEQSLNAVRVTS